MISIGRISAAFTSNTNELRADNEFTSTWIYTDTTLLSVCMSTRGGTELMQTLAKGRFVAVCRGDRDDDGVVFALRSLRKSYHSADTVTFMLESESLISIRPDNLAGGRLLILREGLDDGQIEAASQLTAYLPTMTLARQSAAAGDDDDDTSMLMQGISMALDADAEYDDPLPQP